MGNGGVLTLTAPMATCMEKGGLVLGCALKWRVDERCSPVGAMTLRRSRHVSNKATAHETGGTERTMEDLLVEVDRVDVHRGLAVALRALRWRLECLVAANLLRLERRLVGLQDRVRLSFPVVDVEVVVVGP